MKKIPRVVLLILFLLLMVILLIFSQLSRRSKSKETVIPTPTPFPLPTETLQEKEKGSSQEEIFKYLEEKYPSLPLPSPAEISEKMKIAILLPIKTENYTIEYLPNVDKFFVMILNEPFDVYKKEIEDWFYSQGVKNLEELEIIWQSPTRGKIIPATPAP